MVNGAGARRVCYHCLTANHRPGTQTANRRPPASKKGTMAGSVTHEVAGRTRPEAAIVAALGRRSVVLVGMMGAGKSVDRAAARAAARHPVRRRRHRDREGRRHDHPGYLRHPRRARFPRRRSARDRAPARRRAAGAGDRRRRLHECRHPRGDRRQGHLDLAQGRIRRADAAHQAPPRPPAAQDRRSGRDAARADGRSAIRSMRWPT